MSQQIPHNYLPRSEINTIDWHNSTHKSGEQQQHASLDVYDSFDKLDHTITDYKDALHHLNWIRKPSFEPILPKVSQKVIFTYASCSVFYSYYQI
jgi:hypothetical protein